MRMPQEGRARIKAEALRRIALSGRNDQHKQILADCFAAYFDLSDEDQEEFARIQQEETYKEVPDMTTVWHEQGRKEGEINKSRRLLHTLVEKRFGPISDDTQKKLNALPTERLDELIVSFSEVKSLEEAGLK